VADRGKPYTNGKMVTANQQIAKTNPATKRPISRIVLITFTRRVFPIVMPLLPPRRLADGHTGARSAARSQGTQQGERRVDESLSGIEGHDDPVMAAALACWWAAYSDTTLNGMTASVNLVASGGRQQPLPTTSRRVVYLPEGGDRATNHRSAGSS